MSYPIRATNPYRETAWFIPWGQIWDTMFELRWSWRSGNMYSHDFENVYVECTIGDSRQWIEIGKALDLATLNAQEMEAVIRHAMSNHITVSQLRTQLEDRLRLGLGRTPNERNPEP